MLFNSQMQRIRTSLNVYINVLYLHPLLESFPHLHSCFCPQIQWQSSRLLPSCHSCHAYQSKHCWATGCNSWLYNEWQAIVKLIHALRCGDVAASNTGITLKYIRLTCCLSMYVELNLWIDINGYKATWENRRCDKQYECG